MGYALGLDVGTTFTAAAVFRDGRSQMVNLGQRSASVPSVVFLRDDDTILTGDAAVRRGLTEPDRVAREFKRRIGDSAPLLLGGTPMSADALLACMLASTIKVVTEREGAAPESVAVCHPANWGPYKLDLLRQACARAGLAEPTFISEPEAAATHYAEQERVAPGSVVAVYDLGGGTFDAAVLRKTETGFILLGRPEGIERLGGVDFDLAVVGHVMRHIGDVASGLDRDDRRTIAALARLRQECVDAKETLSVDSETSICVMLPDLNADIRLTRAEFESMIRVPLLDAVAALRRAIQSANVEPSDLAAVLLVGGSSRIPMVAQMVSAEVGRPVAVDTDPKHAVALGAAMAAGGALRTLATVPSPAETATTEARSAPPAPASDPVEAATATTAHAPADAVAPVEEAVVPEPLHIADVAEPPAIDEAATPSTPAKPSVGGRRRLAIAGVIGLALLVVAGGVFALAAGDGGERDFDGWISACPTSSSVCITSVGVEDGSLRARFVSNGVNLVGNASGDQLQAVFFLASVDESGAVSVSRQTSTWHGWGPSSPFRGFSTREAAGSTALCVLVGNGAGEVAPRTGNCAQLPPIR